MEDVNFGAPIKCVTKKNLIAQIKRVFPNMQHLLEETESEKFTSQNHDLNASVYEKAKKIKQSHIPNNLNEFLEVYSKNKEKLAWNEKETFEALLIPKIITCFTEKSMNIGRINELISVKAAKLVKANYGAIGTFLRLQETLFAVKGDRVQYLDDLPKSRKRSLPETVKATKKKKSSDVSLDEWVCTKCKKEYSISKLLNKHLSSGKCPKCYKKK